MLLGFILMGVVLTSTFASTAVTAGDRSQQAYYVVLTLLGLLTTASLILEYRIEAFKKWLREELDRKKEEKD
ncbi:MAG: hypothetical protein HYW90_03210 [Candidatus Sungbacteria bacterium]|nr:hypothetical protein [Candidatus Sungbacteria bacterium]